PVAHVPGSLEQRALEQDPGGGRREEELRAGHRARGAEEGEGGAHTPSARGSGPGDATGATDTGQSNVSPAAPSTPACTSRSTSSRASSAATSSAPGRAAGWRGREGGQPRGSRWRE